jgi:hypothetical protein
VADPLGEYLAGVDDAAADTLRDLDAAIRAAAPELQCAITYRMPTYTLEGRWRHRPPAGSRRELARGGGQGVLLLLDDPLGVLRPGTATLMTWDLPRGADVDAVAVGDYVRNALATREHFLADDKEISAAARATYGR